MDLDHWNSNRCDGVAQGNGGVSITTRIEDHTIRPQLSILQRVNSQPGGHASVVSARGSGTTVTMTWTASLAEEARG